MGSHSVTCLPAEVTFPPELWVLQRLKTSKVTFSLTQGHWQSCHLIGHTWFPINLPLYLCLCLVTLRRHYRLFPKTWRTLSIGRLILNMINQCTKFELSSLSRSINILGRLKFKMGHVTWPRPFQGCRPKARTSYDNQHTKFEVFMFIHTKILKTLKLTNSRPSCC